MPYKAPCTAQSNVRRYRSGLIVAAGNDAAFRDWGSELDDNLVAAGLIPTLDTGQIDWATATFPGVNTTSAGYTVWRFSDTLQLSTPIYIKLEYGRGGGSARPMMWITVGSGTDGAGTITGTYFARQTIFVDQNVTAVVASNPTWSYISISDGFLGIAFKCNPNFGDYDTANLALTMVGGVFLCRTTDTEGNSTTLGLTLFAHNVSGGNALSQICRRIQTTAATYGPYDCAGLIRSQGAPNYPIATGLVGGGPGSSREYQDDNGDYSTQLYAYPIWTTMIRVMPVSQVCSVIAGDFQIGQEFYVATVGQRRRRFIAVGGRSAVVIATTIAVPILAMLWE